MKLKQNAECARISYCYQAPRWRLIFSPALNIKFIMYTPGTNY